MEIGVVNLTKRKVNKKKLNKLAVFLYQELKLNRSIAIVLIAKTKMKTLNLKYRQINKATDVLSFDYPDTKNSEVFINLDDCQKISTYMPLFKKVDNSLDVLNNLLIHSFLHLKGYDDGTEKKRLNMLQLGDRLYDKYLKMKA